MIPSRPTESPQANAAAPRAGGDAPHRFSATRRSPRRVPPPHVGCRRRRVPMVGVFLCGMVYVMSSAFGMGYFR